MKILRIYFLYIIVCFLSIQAQGQTPISISNDRDLDFGSIVAGSAPTTLAPTNQEGARFQVQGERNTAYTIILPTSATLQHTIQSSYSLTINNFTSDPAEGNNGFLPNSRKEWLYIGATISVPFSTLAGNYLGSFTVEVIY